jgi:Na+/H+ antiporter NhaD/arsenite permease-like protein
MTGLHHNVSILIIWAATYLGIAVGRIPGLKINRSGIALLGAIAMMTFGGLSTADVVSYVNWPTILLLFGFLVISAQLRLSGFYGRVASSMAELPGHPAKLMLLIMLITGGLSAVLNHDVVCLVFTPIVTTALLRKGLNPVPYLIALAISSNVGAAATLVGNPQDMMIGQLAGIVFGRYVAWAAVPVVVAMGASFATIWALSHRTIHLPKRQEAQGATERQPYDQAHAIKGLVILAAVILLLFTRVPAEIVVLTAAGIHLASPKFRTDALFGEVSWSILVLFMGLFVVSAAFQSTGYAAEAVGRLERAGLSLHSPAVLTGATAVLSNLISNAAAVMLLVKLMAPLHFAAACVLALANSIGGSLFIIGSVANIIVVQQARHMGVEITFREFSRLGIPATLAGLGGLLLWILLLGVRTV